MKSLTTRRQFLLLFHLSLGNFIVYPQLIAFLMKTFELQNKNAIQWIYGLFMVITSLILSYPVLKLETKHFSQNPLIMFKGIFQSFLLILLSSLVLNGFIVWIFGPVEASNQKALIEQFHLNPSFIIFMALIYAPFVEELLFRGLLINLMKPIKLNYALWISSLLFGLSHMFAQGFVLTDLYFLPTYTVLGFLLAKRYHDSNSLFSSMAVHFLNNLIGVIAFMSL